MKKTFGFMIIAAVLCALTAVSAAFAYDVVVVDKEGRVQRVPAGRKRPEVCMEGMALGEGDTIRTKKDSSVVLALDETGRNAVKVKQLSEVVIKLNSEGQIELIDGEIFAVLNAMKDGTKFAIKTPGAVCGARGTGWVTTLKAGVTTSEVFDGTIFTQGLSPDGTDNGEQFFTGAGFMIKVDRLGGIEGQLKLTVERMNELQATSQEMMYLERLVSKWTDSQKITSVQDKMVEKFMTKGRDFDARSPMMAPAPTPSGRDDDNRKKGGGNSDSDGPR